MSDVSIDADFKQLEKLIKELDSDYYVDIGILGKQTATEDGITLAGIGAVQEFGKIINHPGGTPYKIVGKGKSVFVKKGSADAIGVTGPHQISIPERSFIRMPLEKKAKDIQKDAENIMQDSMEKQDIKQIFTTIGISGEAAIKEAFATRGFGSWAPNAESTVRQKDSDSPLIDEGALRNGITSKVSKAK